jgi:hypothetical protein
MTNLSIGYSARTCSGGRCPVTMGTDGAGRFRVSVFLLTSTEVTLPDSACTYFLFLATIDCEHLAIANELNRAKSRTLKHRLR